MTLFAEGKYDDAVETLCAAVDLDPTDPRPFQFLGKVSTASPAHMPEIRKRLEGFVHLYPNNGLANYYYAMSLWKRTEGEPVADTAVIEALLKKAIAASPDFYEAHFQLGILYQDQQKYPEAIREFEQTTCPSPRLQPRALSSVSLVQPHPPEATGRPTPGDAQADKTRGRTGGRSRRYSWEHPGKANHGDTTLVSGWNGGRNGALRHYNDPRRSRLLEHSRFRDLGSSRGIEDAISWSRREFLRAATGATAATVLSAFSPLRAMAMRKGQKAVVVTFGGGTRDEETFMPEGQENIPHLLREFVPQGTFFTQVVNRGILGHYVATASLVTGVYETFNNFAAVSPENPTVFEYFRKDLHRPASDTWVVAPSNGFGLIGESSHSSHGPGQGAGVILPKRLLAAAMATHDSSRLRASVARQLREPGLCAGVGRQ